MSEGPLGGGAHGPASMVSGPACPPGAEWVLRGAPASLTAVSSGGLWWVLVPLGVRALHQLQTFPPLPFVNRV